MRCWTAARARPGSAALGDVELLRLDREHFEAYVRQCTPAALNLLSVAARRLRRSDEVIRRTVTRNVNDVAAEQGTLLTRLADAVPAFTGSIAIAGVSRGVSGRLDRDQSKLDPKHESLRSLSRSNSSR